MLKALGCGLAAVLATLLMGIWHRAVVTLGPLDAFPLGLVLGLLGVFGWAVAARALAGGAGAFAAAVGAFVASQAAALPGPGGDLLIQGDVTGFAWAIAAPVAAMAASFLPRSWFRRLSRGDR
ncbi:MAG: hypothetical protein LBD70_05080 [Bifidobacteriaceae bacterium]|nr:hypothetical protein [Bifidobacteriaceae bacterium]